MSGSRLWTPMLTRLKPAPSQARARSRVVLDGFASKVISAHPDVVFINTYGLVAAHLMENFNDAHVSFPIWGSGAFSNTPVVGFSTS